MSTVSAKMGPAHLIGGSLGPHGISHASTTKHLHSAHAAADDPGQDGTRSVEMAKRWADKSVPPLGHHSRVVSAPVKLEPERAAELAMELVSHSEQTEAWAMGTHPRPGLQYRATLIDSSGSRLPAQLVGGGQKVFKCQVCGVRRFKSASALGGHLRHCEDRLRKHSNGARAQALDAPAPAQKPRRKRTRRNAAAVANLVVGDFFETSRRKGSPPNMWDILSTSG